MRKPQDTKNLLIVNKLVENHFNLTDESQKLFKYRTLYDINKAPEFMNIIGDAPDLRRRFKIKGEDLQTIDEGWSLFKSVFYYFVNTTEIKYKNFLEGRILVNKNEIKLFKALFNFYKKEKGFLNVLFNNVYEDIDISNTIKEAVIKYINNKFGEARRSEPYASFCNKNGLMLNISYCGPRESDKNYNTYGEFPCENILSIPFEDIFTNEGGEDLLRKALTKQFNKIGSISLPKKEFELVISCNPADIFMASTGESWSSCISMNSDYEECYWSGIPGAIVDKNRAIVYITDGKKKHYNGIEVDKFTIRSWLLTFRNKADNKSYIQVVAEYPIVVGIEKVLRTLIKELNFVSYDNDEGIQKGISKYYFEGIYFQTVGEIKVLSYIYLDSSKIKLAKKNKGKCFPNSYFYHKSGGGGHSNCGVNEKTEEFKSFVNYYFNNKGRGDLSFLIEEDRNLTIQIRYGNDYEDDFEDDFEDDSQEEEVIEDDSEEEEVIEDDFEDDSEEEEVAEPLQSFYNVFYNGPIINNWINWTTTTEQIILNASLTTDN